MARLLQARRPANVYGPTRFSIRYCAALGLRVLKSFASGLVRDPFRCLASRYSPLVFKATSQGILITERSLFDVSVRLVAYGTRPDGKWTLAVVSSGDQISFLNSFYEVEVRNWQSVDPISSIHWSTDGTMLAVVCSPNKIVILNNRGRVMHSFAAPTKSPMAALTAFCWSHEDHAIIVSGRFGDGEFRLPRVGRSLSGESCIPLRCHNWFPTRFGSISVGRRNYPTSC